MKLEIKENIEQAFTPITFTVTLESKEELVSWYARMNASFDSIKEGADNYTLYSSTDSAGSWVMYEFLKEELRRLS